MGTTVRVEVYIISLVAGLLVGVIYALLQVRSPAPPARATTPPSARY